MAKIERKHQKIFAGDVPVTNVVAEFGSLAAGAAAYSSDPDDIQSTRYSEGWSQAVINNYAPCIQDLNALFNLITRQLAYIFQAGIPEWLTTTNYYIGSLVTDSTGGIFMSLADDNSGNALTMANKWMPILVRNFVSLDSPNVSYDVTNSDFIILINAVSGYANTAPWVILPAPSAANSGREIIVKQIITPNGSDGFSRVYASDDSTIDGNDYISMNAQWLTKRFISDGTHWHVI